MSDSVAIKNYSSIFATKINYVLDLIQVTPLQHGRLKAIEKITTEKSTTVNNWLFNGKLPRDNKKLCIADSVGISYKYLFSDEIDIKDVSKPEIYNDGHCYLIPYIDENEIFNLKSKSIYPIHNRLPIMFPNFDSFIQKYGTNIYITKLKTNVFEPYVPTNSEIIYSEKVVFEDFRLVIHDDIVRKEFIVKRVIEENNNYYLEFMNNKKLIKEPLNKNDNFLSIVLTYSN